MKVCFPVIDLNGTESKIFGHFGSARKFIVVNTDDRNITVLENDEHHDHSKNIHGACNPLRSFKGVFIDALVTRGIGNGALRKLKNSGIKVFQAKAKTVKDNLDMFVKGELQEFDQSGTCRGHGSGCSH
jgi:predicted Fe-Mo cluster-binding NifX family protein